MKKCENVLKSVKNYETILPFSCCPLVFLWYVCNTMKMYEKTFRSGFLPWAFNESWKLSDFAHHPLRNILLLLWVDPSLNPSPTPTPERCVSCINRSTKFPGLKTAVFFVFREERLNCMRQDGLVGNGRNTVSRVLFRRRELTEPHWVLGQTRWVLRKTRWDRFGTQIIGWEELTELSSQNSLRAKKLTEFGVRNRTLRNRIRPVSELGRGQQGKRNAHKVVRWIHRIQIHPVHHFVMSVMTLQRVNIQGAQPSSRLPRGFASQRASGFS